MRSRVVFLVVLTTLAGCVQLTPAQEAAWARAVVARGAPAQCREPYDPDVALGLSFALPGLGHLYLGEPARAVGWFVASAVLPGAPFVAAWVDARELDRRAVAEAQMAREAAVRDDPRSLSISPCRACGVEFECGQASCPRCGARRDR